MKSLHTILYYTLDTTLANLVDLLKAGRRRDFWGTFVCSAWCACHHTANAIVSTSAHTTSAAILLLKCNTIQYPRLLRHMRCLFLLTGSVNAGQFYLTYIALYTSPTCLPVHSTRVQIQAILGRIDRHCTALELYCNILCDHVVCNVHVVITIP